MTRKRATSTDAKSAATCTASPPSSMSMKEQSQRLQEMLHEGSWNPFQRASGTLLERLHKQAAKRIIETTEDAWL